MSLVASAVTLYSLNLLLAQLLDRHHLFQRQVIQLNR
jgi:hypothetical protein